MPFYSDICDNKFDSWFNSISIFVTFIVSSILENFVYATVLTIFAVVAFDQTKL